MTPSVRGAAASAPKPNNAYVDQPTYNEAQTNDHGADRAKKAATRSIDKSKYLLFDFSANDD